MDREVFSSKELGEFYNDNFINFKVDAEVDEGVELSKLHNVEGFPTFIYLDAKGDLLKKSNSIGFSNVDGMLQLAKESLGDTSFKPWEWYEEQYKNGNRELEFLKQYVEEQLRAKQMPPSDKLKEEIFLATPEEERFVKGSEMYDTVWWTARPGNLFYEELLKNKDAYADRFADRQTSVRFVEQILMMSRFSSGSTPEELDKINSRLKKDFPEVYEIASRGQEIDSMRLDGSGADAYVKAYIEWARENDLPLNYSFGFSGQVLEMKDLTPEYAKLALPVFEERVKEDSSHFYSVVGYCYLIYKSGDHDGAFEKAKEFKELTESFNGNKKMAQLYSVMEALEAKQDPTEAMQSRH